MKIRGQSNKVIYVIFMLKKNVVMSRFVTLFKIDKDTICYYHSLKNKPIYLNIEQDRAFQEYLHNGKITDKIKDLVEKFIDNGFIVFNISDDERLLDSVRRKISRPGISIAYFILSESCNLNCNYCFINQGKKNLFTAIDIMSIDVGKKSFLYFIKQSVKSGISNDIHREIIFYGGEPLINFICLKSVIDYYYEIKRTDICPFDIDFSVVSNGTLITEDMARYFAMHNVSVSISLDGPDEHSNSNRIYKGNGKCAYEGIINGINILQQYGCIVSLSLTLSQEALSVSIEDLILFLKKNHISSLSFNTLLLPNFTTIRQNYYEEAANYIINFRKHAKKERIYEDRISRKITSFLTGEIKYSDCAAIAGSQLTFYPDGQIRICHGNKNCLGEEKRWSIYDDIDLNKEKALEKWVCKSQIFDDSCVSCSAVGICGKGCELNFSRNKDNKDHGFCVQTKSILNYMIRELFYRLSSKN